MKQEMPFWAVKQIVREHGLLEWICKHGCGHPCNQQDKTFKKVDGWAIHGCDGCCNKKQERQTANVVTSKSRPETERNIRPVSPKGAGQFLKPSAPESLMPRCKKHNARHRRLWPFKSCKYDGEKITLVKIK